MLYTNKFNYPQPFVRAVTADNYDRGEADWTVSELISPPRLHQLVKRHDAELVEDVSDRLWVLDGLVAHEILARSGKEHLELFEKRLYATLGGKKLGGKLDSLALDEERLTDYKRTSVWSFIFGKDEWVWQLNMYGFLARENGYDVGELEIFAMFRDWEENRSLNSRDYPKMNCLRIPIEMWSHEQTRTWIRERIRLHEAAKTQADDYLPDCTPKERWTKKGVWAVMKPKRISAVSLHDTEEAAKAACPGGASVVYRPGSPRRCSGGYCPAGKAGKCSQWAKDPQNLVTANEIIAV